MKPPLGRVFIYALVAEGEGARYIGVTKCRLNKRLREHRHEAKTQDTRKARWLRKCLKNGVAVRIVQVATVPEAEWPNWERAFIRRAKERGARLTNTCEGGLGLLGLPAGILEKRGQFWLGRKHTEQSKAKISAAKKNPSAETRAKISAAAKRQHAEGRVAPPPWKGKKRPRDIVEKIAAMRRGKPRSAQAAANAADGVRAFWASDRSKVARQRQSARVKGKPLSEAHCDKLKAAWVKRKARALVVL